VVALPRLLSHLAIEERWEDGRAIEARPNSKEEQALQRPPVRCLSPSRPVPYPLPREGQETYGRPVCRSGQPDKSGRLHRGMPACRTPSGPWEPNPRWEVTAALPHPGPDPVPARAMRGIMREGRRAWMQLRKEFCRRRRACCPSNRKRESDYNWLTVSRSEGKNLQLRKTMRDLSTQSIRCRRAASEGVAPLCGGEEPDACRFAWPAPQKLRMLRRPSANRALP
jgi:hypothetical protein